ncbi:MAG: hypothetical protein M1823_001002 [Watsoniomyces obsoletus]|nr:MAG: hypothetical protein M1823_001002 [Watsoniomyces obsoletus]
MAWTAWSSIRSTHARNVSTLRRSPLSEISGALGDLGTLLPILIALTVKGSISLSSTLLFSGLANIFTGIVFGLPLPVQPMKAIAADALGHSFSVAETVSAGLLVAVVILIFSLTGLLRWFSRVIPIPVVKGIQMGAGLSLIVSAGSSLLGPILDSVYPVWTDNSLWASFAFLLLLATAHTPRFPYALVVFVLGLSLALLGMFLSDEFRLPSPGLWRPPLILPTPSTLNGRAWDSATGQIPLTILNSIIAVNHLAADLFPAIRTPSTTEFGLSVAAMNIVGCWFGAMPVCHGSGGLAGQFRFGARSGASVILLGAFKLVLGLVLGESLVGLLQKFPKSLLGVMVIAAGLELAKVGETLNTVARDLDEEALADVEGEDGLMMNKNKREPDSEESSRRWTIMFMTVGGYLAIGNAAAGFAAGILCHWSFEWHDRFEKWRARRRQEQLTSNEETERQSLLEGADPT